MKNIFTPILSKPGKKPDATFKLLYSSLYNPLQLTAKYISYYLSASSGKGHGVHSPFVFDFVRSVLMDKTAYPDYAAIESIRKALLNNNQVLSVEDKGAGSIRTQERKLADIARSSLKSPKYAQLLYRVVKKYQPRTILELGTSFGLTSAYLSKANAAAKIITAEGSPAIAELARMNFSKLSLSNIELVEGDFKNTLPGILERNPVIDMAFIDGNHQEEPTCSYFEQILENVHQGSILVFDDIRWSRGMEAAWKRIREHPKVTLTIDLFFMSFVFFNPDFNHQQRFVIRF